MNNANAALYLPALGIINALGNHKQAVWDGLIRMDQSGIIERDDLLVNGSCQVAAVTMPLTALPIAFKKMDSRNNRLLMAAANEISTEIGALKATFGADRIAVILGTSTSGIAETEAALLQLARNHPMPENYCYQQQEMSSPAEFLASWLGLSNAAFTVSTACSSSAKVFASASNLIRSGVCDAAIVGGVDTLCRLTLNGFNSLESIASNRCLPFSKNRDGITIGEAAALFIVSPEPAAIRLCGVGESSDAHHMSAPDPEGFGAQRSMQAALDAAQLQSQHIDYINLHGTATIKNDQMEALAVNRLFGDSVCCSSTKALTGHTLGAAGATEVGLCWLSLSEHNQQQLLPTHCWDHAVDDQLAAISLVTDATPLAANKAHYLMSNSFAFGGNNVSVIIGRDSTQGASTQRHSHR